MLSGLSFLCIIQALRENEPPAPHSPSFWDALPTAVVTSRASLHWVSDGMSVTCFSVQVVAPTLQAVSRVTRKILRVLHSYHMHRPKRGRSPTHRERQRFSGHDVFARGDSVTEPESIKNNARQQLCPATLPLTHIISALLNLITLPVLRTSPQPLLLSVMANVRRHEYSEL